MQTPNTITSPETPPPAPSRFRRALASLRGLFLDFCSAEKWERHEEARHELREERRLFIEYLSIVSLVMGLVLLMAVFKPSGNPLETQVQDWLMTWLAKTPHDVSPRDFPQILFIDVDEASWRDPRWGGGEPRAVPLKPLADLIDRAVDTGARYILTDFVVDGPTDRDMEDFYRAVRAVVDRTIREGRDCRFLFVRSIREPLEDGEGPPVIRPSFALDRLMAEYPDRVHGVSTNFVRTDEVVRYWRLWESACLARPGADGGPGDRVWAVLPAAQLAIRTLEQERGASGRPMPWTPERLLAPAPSGDIPPLAGDDRCGRIAADFHAGRWINETFDRCYQQDHFTARDCRAAAPDCSRESAGLKKRANRVFFYWSDWHWGEGEDRRPLRHLYRVPARTLWAAAETPEKAATSAPDDETLARLALFKRRVSPEQGGGAPGLAIIGASYKASHDFHKTPASDDLMAGPLLLANAVATMTLHGPLQEMGVWPGLLVTLGMIVLFSASLTWVTVWFGRGSGGWFAARRDRLVAWFRSRVTEDGRCRVFGLPVPGPLRDRAAELASWEPDARIAAFWVVILLFFLLTWFLLAEWKIWFNFTLTVSFMYCLLEIRSTALWQALAALALVRLLL